MLSFCARRYGLCAAAVLLLAAWNLGYRLDRDIVQTWDESLYGTTAAEMMARGDWVVTTFLGEVDYYNAKPPLNVWLIALSFTAFGINLVSLRLASALSAWLTIAGGAVVVPTRHRPPGGAGGQSRAQHDVRVLLPALRSEWQRGRDVHPVQHPYRVRAVA